MTLKELVASFEAKNRQLQDTLGKSDLTAQDVEAAKALNSELDGLKGQIVTLQGADQLRGAASANDAFINAPGARLPNDVTNLGFKPAGAVETDGREVRDLGGEGALSRKQAELVRTVDYKRAFQSYIYRKGQLDMMDIIERKTLSEGSDTAGGFVVPEDFLAQLIEKKPTPTRINDYVRQVNTSRDALVMPKVNYATDDIYTTGVRVTWTGEVPASSTASRVTDPTFGQVRIPVYTGMLSMPLTRDLIEDSAFDLQGWATGKFRETFDILKDNMILNGTGQGQPSGILLAPGAANQPAVVSMGNPMTADGIQSVAWSVPEQYEDKLRWVFNKTNVGQAFAKLKDSNSRYLWATLDNSGILEQSINRPLLGYPVTFSGLMPNTGVNNYPVIFGDLSGYYMVNRVGFSIQVLNELYAETNQVLLLGRMRFGGQVAEDWKLKIGQQA